MILLKDFSFCTWLVTQKLVVCLGNGAICSRLCYANKLLEIKIAENIGYANNIQLKGSKAFSKCAQPEPQRRTTWNWLPSHERRGNSKRSRRRLRTCSKTQPHNGRERLCESVSAWASWLPLSLCLSACSIHRRIIIINANYLHIRSHTGCDGCSPARAAVLLLLSLPLLVFRPGCVCVVGALKRS